MQCIAKGILLYIIALSIKEQLLQNMAREEYYLEKNSSNSAQDHPLFISAYTCKTCDYDL